MNYFSFLYHYLTIRNVPWLKKKEIEKIKLRKLKKILRHAYNFVPYYHRLFNSVNVKPEDIKTISDLSKIPVTTKTEILQAGVNVLANNVNHNKCFKTRTSGSAGMPIDIIYRRKDINILNLIHHRSYLENGLGLRDKRVSIVEKPSKKYLFQHLGLMRKEPISLYADPSYVIDVIQKTGSRFLTGLPSNIVLVALEIRKKDIKGIPIKTVFTSAEILDISTRKFLESVFGEVFDYYGAKEVGQISWECSEHSGYHINEDSVIVDFVKNGEAVAPGESGEIVCTGLHSYAMPFIRYTVGDIGVPSCEECNCGRSFPMMERIEGRIVDFLILNGGRLVSPYTLTCALENVPGLIRYQIIQEEVGHIKIKLISDEKFGPESLHQIEEEVKRVLGNDVKVEIVMDDISKDESGKFRVVKSLVSVKSY